MVNTVGDRSRERARQDYVKAIYRLSSAGPVRAADLARELGVTRASVSKCRRMLEREKLVFPSQRPTDGLRLTRKGEALALRMVRRHRLVETFLHRTLRVPLDRVHLEAERIEHSISDDVSTRLAGFLHNPDLDPHGHAIPSRVRQGIASREQALRTISAGSTVIIASIDDHRPEIVRALTKCGVLPGARVRVARNEGSAMRLVVARRSVRMPARTAEAVRCLVQTPGKVA